MSVEQQEDLTKIDSADLHKRIGEGRYDRDSYARAVCYALQDGAEPAYYLERFCAVEAELEVLYAENTRRCDEYRSRGLI